MEPTTKRCARCGKKKPKTREYFYRHYDGLYSWCKVCSREAGTEYVKRAREKDNDLYTCEPVARPNPKCDDFTWFLYMASLYGFKGMNKLMHRWDAWNKNNARINKQKKYWSVSAYLVDKLERSRK